MARQCRIRYEENYNGRGEHFIFEIKKGDDWGLDKAFKLIGDNADLISYQALTEIRDLQDLGFEVFFE